MVWDLYDGRGTGLASAQGLPQYFACQMTADGTSTHSISP